MIKNILITLSVLINGTLIMYVTGIIPFLLFMSVLIIIALSWYIRQLLVRVQTVDSDFEQLYEELEKFSEHIDSLYNLEMFYGDETLQSLLVHSRDLLGTIDGYQAKYTSADIFDEDYLEEGEKELDDDEQEPTPSPPQALGQVE